MLFATFVRAIPAIRFAAGDLAAATARVPTAAARVQTAVDRRRI